MIEDYSFHYIKIDDYNITHFQNPFFSGFQKVDESFFCLTKLIDNEYFYVCPSWKLMRLRDMQIFDIETENPRKSKSRRRSSSGGGGGSAKPNGTYRNFGDQDELNKDMGTFHLRYQIFRSKVHT